MEKLLEQLQIDTLYHFTQTDNLYNIFQYGLVSRKELQRNNTINSKFNDNYRYDKCTDAVCTSIEFPNYKMFYKLRMNNPDVDWAVLKLDARIMCDFLCAYCWTNAGDASMYNIPLQQRMGKNAFLELFRDYPNYPTRRELCIPNYYPTNPQAEVLVFGTIPTTYIQQVYFEDATTFIKYKNIFPYISDILEYNKEVFLPRQDWEFWKS